MVGNRFMKEQCRMDDKRALFAGNGLAKQGCSYSPAWGSGNETVAFDLHSRAFLQGRLEEKTIPDDPQRIRTTRRALAKTGKVHHRFEGDVAKAGDPDRIRTCDLQFRKLPLYPAELRDLSGSALVAGFRGLCIPLLRACVAAIFAVGLAHAQSITPGACTPEAALPAEIQRIETDGSISLKEGPVLKLANIVWPDHLEPNLREKLAKGLMESMQGQRITWKAVAPPDRWGATPAHLFVQEPDAGLAPFWLQAGMVEAGLVPAWPDVPGRCWEELLRHEALAIADRRGHWAPRVQAQRLATIAADPTRHAGRRMVVIWTIAAVRPWREIFFLNIRGAGRTGPSLSATPATISALTQRGQSPEALARQRAVFRFLVSREGLRRSRLDSADHLSLLEKAGSAPQR